LLTHTAQVILLVQDSLNLPMKTATLFLPHSLLLCITFSTQKTATIYQNSIILYSLKNSRFFLYISTQTEQFYFFIFIFILHIKQPEPYCSPQNNTKTNINNEHKQQQQDRPLAFLK
jgi:hypothetical protein